MAYVFRGGLNELRVELVTATALVVAATALVAVTVLGTEDNC